MNIEQIIEQSRSYPLDVRCGQAGVRDIEAVLGRRQTGLDDFALLLSDTAQECLEPMAEKAAALTRAHFGNVIFLFTPLYISSYCDNGCPYCSFSCAHDIERRQLSSSELADESARIAASGIRHILVLTGEARGHATFDYVKSSIGIIAGSFSSVGIEMYPMTGTEYGELIGSGVDSLTVYQEVYDRNAYAMYHQNGPKKDYNFRLEAADRACRQSIRSVAVGALLGLADFRREMFSLANHVQYLQDTYPGVDISVSFPRIRPLVRDFNVPNPVSDKQLVQIITAFRILFPHIGITLSTRESKEFRNGMLPLGVTRMSAGVSTAVGGHTQSGSSGQFEISDTRGVDEMRKDILALGFQPVMHDWSRSLIQADGELE